MPTNDTSTISLRPTPVINLRPDPVFDSGSFNPDSQQTLLQGGLLIAPVLGLAIGRAASISDDITSLDQVAGTLTLSGGSLISNLTTPFGALQETFDLVALATDLDESLGAISGTLNLAGGTALGNLAVGDEDFAGSFEFARLVGGFVSNFVSTLDGTAAFSNGQVAIDLPTPFGDVEGTIGFGSGALVADLTTPFGAIDFSLDFPDDAQFSVPFPQLGGATATLDLAASELAIDLLSFLPGAEVVLPLTSFSGSVAFNDGLANISVNSPFGSYGFQLNVAEEVGEGLTEFLTGVTGTLGIGAGQLSANLTNDLGSFAGTLDVGQFLNRVVDTLPQYVGTLTLANGSVVAALTTPYGAIDETFNYGQYLDDIAAVVGDLSAIA